MAVSYSPDASGLAQLAGSQQVADVALAAAYEGAQWAQANAPRDTGEYASSFEAEAAEVSAGGRSRAGAVLLNTAGHALYVETTNGDHVLARAASVIERA